MKVAIVGATGLVGETLLRVLEERNVAIETLQCFAARPRSEPLRFGGRAVSVQPVAELEPGADVVFFCGSEDASERYVPQFLEHGALVIDNSPAYRLEANVPLIVPEINGELLRSSDRLLPVANCSAIILSLALAPLRDATELQSVCVATYQAVSGAGRAGLNELRGGIDVPDGVFGAPIVGNVIPRIGDFDPHGSAIEEVKIVAETRKILDRERLPIAALAVRVPVAFAHSQAVFFETARPASVAELNEALAGSPALRVHREGIVTPRDVEGTDLVHVARVRAQDDSGRRFVMWVCGDQLRKGAATNAVQLLELSQERRSVAV